MRRVLEALEQRAIKVTKAEVDWLITDARSSIQAFVEDNGNQAELKHALDLLQKTTSVLKIMQVHGGVLLANETAQVVEKLINEEIENTEQAQDVVSRAVVGLSDYLEHVEAGNKDIPIVLMPLLNDLRASRGEPLLSENILFFPNLDNIQLPEISVEGSDNDSGWQNAIRSKFQKALLDCVNGKDIPSATSQICKLCVLLHKGCRSDNAQRLWWLASALAQAIAIKAVPFSSTMVSIFSTVDRKIKALIDEGESVFTDNSTDSLVKNILYYLAIAEDRGRIVNQVKQAYALNEQIPENQKLEELRQQISGPSSEVLIAVSKALLEDVASAKDCIELYIHSKFEQQDYLDRLLTGLVKIGDTLSMIGIDEYREKIDLQIHEAELIKQGEQTDVDLSLLSISEAILEVETCINNFIEYRINFKSDGKVQPNDDNAFEASFSSNEHKAAFNVAVSEALLRIEQVKELLTEVVHIAFDENKCANAIHNLYDISGVISVIDLQAPANLLEGICAYLSSNRFRNNVAEGADALQDLADCVVSLQCYFEQIELRVPYAEQILDYSKHALSRISAPEQVDSDSQEQDSIEDDSSIDLNFGVDELEQLPKAEDSVVVKQRAADTEIEQNFDLLPDLDVFESGHNELDFNTDETAAKNLDQQIEPEEATPVIANQVEQPIAAPDVSSSSNDISKEVVQQQPQLKVLADNSDPEVLETFIEEATQVIFDIKQHWANWQKNQQDWQSFTDMRRGFHTLKGSGRFAGAEILGEFAWSFENLCNKLISKKDFVPQEKQALLRQALEVVPELITQLKDPQVNIEIDVYQLIEQARDLANDAGKPEKTIENKATNEKASS